MLFWKRKPKMPTPIMARWLAPVDGHEIYYHVYGNPNGETVLAFHGGPGGGSKPKHALRFNLEKYRVILFDQRGCGKSRYTDLLKNNTPAAAVDDAKRILDDMGINTPVIVNGGSYGSTVALLFAEKYPKLTSRLWLASIFLGRARDVADWMERDAARFYPDIFDELKAVAGRAKFGAVFARDLMSDDDARVRRAMKYYGTLEHNIGSLNPGFELPSDEDYATEVDAFKIYVNMAQNNFFLSDDQIIKNAKKIAHIPTTIIHNRLDMCCPIEQAWALHKALPKSQIHIIPAHGHGSALMDQKIKEVLV